MIPQTSKISKQILGSSLTFSAQGGRGKEKNQKPVAKNFASPNEDEAATASNSIWWSILKVVQTHFVPTAVADEGLAKNSEPKF
ncbi:hypothetical protein KJ991_02485 [Patescibacteria group bacterium]|nr:hypothetical protein [Patescibacteria group bacterium]MBU4057769.1 hypothetical protein [Patescibacteria group bacterium]MBU4115855.1 hypothetical protein [Patescibacteria group bacterium]